jgi:hypothetical protein
MVERISNIKCNELYEEAGPRKTFIYQPDDAVAAFVKNAGLPHPLTTSMPMLATRS